MRVVRPVSVITMSKRLSARVRKAGSLDGIRRPRLVRTLRPTANNSGRATWIFCPWLKRLHRESDIWTSVLAVHDVNGTLLSALPPLGKGRWPHVYAGIFAVDALHARAELIRRIVAAGVGGVINFPSVSFFDGEADAVFARLSLGVDRELDCLEACAKAGLRVGGVVRSVHATKRILSIGADFLMVHHGPPGVVGFDVESTREIAGLARQKNIPVFSMSELI